MGGPASDKEGPREPHRGRQHRRLRLAWGFPFIGSEKRILRRCIQERSIVLTVEAQARLDALPETFRDFIAAPASFAVQLEAEAA